METPKRELETKYSIKKNFTVCAAHSHNVLEGILSGFKAAAFIGRIRSRNFPPNHLLATAAKWSLLKA